MTETIVSEQTPQLEGQLEGKERAERIISSKDDRAKMRHPEKAKRPDAPIQRKPSWIRVKAPVSKGYQETRKLMRDNNLTTVCEEAACPNIGECWSKKTCNNDDNGRDLYPCLFIL